MPKSMLYKKNNVKKKLNKKNQKIIFLVIFNGFFFFNKLPHKKYIKMITSRGDKPQAINN